LSLSKPEPIQIHRLVSIITVTKSSSVITFLNHKPQFSEKLLKKCVAPACRRGQAQQLMLLSTIKDNKPTDRDPVMALEIVKFVMYGR
jgi:hypothetical protein